MNGSFISMLDFMKNEVKVGDKVVFAPAGAYAGICVGIVAKITKKQIGIEKDTGYAGRHLNRDKKDLYYTYAGQVLVIESGSVNEVVVGDEN